MFAFTLLYDVAERVQRLIPHGLNVSLYSTLGTAEYQRLQFAKLKGMIIL